MGKIDIILKPVVTEKSAKLAEKGKYTFLVDPSANKNQIRESFKSIYGVKVGRVRTARKRGRRRRIFRAGKWIMEKYQKSEKKAIIEVKKGKNQLAKLFKF